uniref:Uncharacterized protein n=1 Tax=Setaria italica TaxID=4555 RepID=K3ZBG0_SETIT
MNKPDSQSMYGTVHNYTRRAISMDGGRRRGSAPIRPASSRRCSQDGRRRPRRSPAATALRPLLLVPAAEVRWS